MLIVSSKSTQQTQETTASIFLPVECPSLLISSLPSTLHSMIQFTQKTRTMPLFVEQLITLLLELNRELDDAQYLINEIECIGGIAGLVMKEIARYDEVVAEFTHLAQRNLRKSNDKIDRWLLLISFVIQSRNSVIAKRRLSSANTSAIESCLIHMRSKLESATGNNENQGCNNANEASNDRLGN